MILLARNTITWMSTFFTCLELEGPSVRRVLLQESTYKGNLQKMETTGCLWFGDIGIGRV